MYPATKMETSQIKRKCTLQDSKTSLVIIQFQHNSNITVVVYKSASTSLLHIRQYLISVALH